MRTTTRRIINVGFAALLELVGGLGLFFSSLLRETRPDSGDHVATTDAGTDTRDPGIRRSSASHAISAPARR